MPRQWLPGVECECPEVEAWFVMKKSSIRTGNSKSVWECENCGTEVEYDSTMGRGKR